MLGPETEWPVGLIPSKEEKDVLKPIFKRFEDEIKIAESTTQDIVLEDGKVLDNFQDLNFRLCIQPLVQL